MLKLYNGRMRKILFFFLMMLMTGQAQAAPKIVAVVNDELITSQDIAERKKLVQATDAKAFARAGNVDKAILEILVEESIKRTAAKNEGLSADETEIKSAVEDIEKRSGKSKGSFESFLKENGIDAATLRNYLTADVVWVKLIKKKFGTLASVSDKRIDEELEKMKAKNGKTHYLLGEIFLPVKSFSENQTVHRQAVSLIEDLKTGGINFQQAARTYSKAPSSAAGGETGYVSEDELSPALRGKIKEMKVGELSAPVFADGGYYILYLADKKTPPIMKTLPTKDQIKASLYGQFLENAANSYFEDLKQNAIIVYK